MKATLLFILSILIFAISKSQTNTCYQERINRAKAAYNNCDYKKALKWIESITTDQCIIPAKNEIKSLTAKINAGMGDNCDNDGDGVVNRIDKCPTTAGPKSKNGCPVADSDNDGFADNVDGCPDTYSTTNRGCPEGPRQLYFLEKFDDYKNKWTLGQASRIREGKLYLADTAYDAEATKLYDIDCSKDFSCSVQASWLNDNRGFFGFIFSSNASSAYKFIISPDGMYAVYTANAESSSSLVEWTSSPDIKTGRMQNVLKIEKTNDFITFYINGRAQDTLPFPDGHGGVFGLCAAGQGPKYVEFDDFYLQGQTKAGGTYKTTGKKYAFTDYFIDNANGWSLNEDATKKISIDDGKLTISGLNSGYSYGTSRSHKLDVSKDFTCYAELTVKKGTNSGFGMIFCESRDRSYALLMSEGGSFSVSKLENKKWETLVPWKTFSPGYNADGNKMLIKKRGRNIDFYVNDSLLATLPFMSGAGTYFGFRTEGNQTVQFDNFMLTGERL